MKIKKYIMGAKISMIASACLASSGVIISELPNADTIDAFQKTPAALALIGLAIICVYIAYRLMSRAMDIVSNDMGKLHSSLQGLSNELKERPCIRKPTNN